MKNMYLIGGTMGVGKTAVPQYLKTERIMADVKKGIRQADVLDRSIARLPLYLKLNSAKIDTDGKSVKEIADEISAL